MDYKILVIDDDKMMHLAAKNLLGKEYQLLYAHDAQDAVNMIAEETIHLILSDIHMPGIDGLEFLESLMSDSERKNIPVLIMTGLPTIDKEKNALDLGAADFIDKKLFKENPQSIIELINAKLVTTLDMDSLTRQFQLDKKEFVKKLMEEVHVGDFFTVARRLCSMANNIFSIDYAFFWTIQDGDARMVLGVGKKPMHLFGPEDLEKEKTFHEFLSEKKPYISNHVFGDQAGIFKEASKKENLPAEIGIPLYKVTDKEFLELGRKIPSDAELFGYVVLKRNKLVTTKEFNLISNLFIQSGTILWRMYQNI
jgi:CheY-like chemotaxis protein